MPDVTGAGAGVEQQEGGAAAQVGDGCRDLQQVAFVWKLVTNCVHFPRT